MKLDGAVVLVTGAGHRLGRAIALGLAKRGASIIVHYGSSERQAEQTAQKVRDLGSEAWVVQADLSSADAGERLYQSMGSGAGRLDAVVHSAASFRHGSIEQVDADIWDRILSVNLRAPYLVTRALLPALRRGAEDGASATVVHVCDLSGVHPWDGYSVHGVSKAGLLHLTKTLARELAPEVRVNAVIPGAILPAPGVDVESEQWQHWGERLPLQRTGAPEDVVSTIAFLMESGFITGAAISVDGGENLLGIGARRAPEDQAPTDG